jgi:hypothetical protein
MNDWLVKMASKAPSDEGQLKLAMGLLNADDLRELALDAGVAEPTEHLESFEERFEQADLMGREMAHIHGDSLEKQAVLGALAAGAGRLLGGGALKGIGGAIAKNVAIDGATNAVSGALSKNRQAAPAAAGGFKYASEKTASLEQAAFTEFCKEAGLASSLVSGVGSSAKGNGLLRSVAGGMMRHPGMAGAAAGAAVGAAGGLLKDPGYDAQGNRNSRLGAATKGALGGAAVGGAAAHFIPGAKQSIQGAGKALSGELRASSYRNLKGPLGAKPAAPALSGGGAVATGSPRPAGPVAAASSTASPVATENAAALDAMKSGIKVPTSSLPADHLVSQGGVNVPASMAQNSMVGRGGRVVQSSADLSGLSSVERIKLVVAMGR